MVYYPFNCELVTRSSFAQTNRKPFQASGLVITDQARCNSLAQWSPARVRSPERAVAFGYITPQNGSSLGLKSGGLNSVNSDSIEKCYWWDKSCNSTHEGGEDSALRLNDCRVSIVRTGCFA